MHARIDMATDLTRKAMPHVEANVARSIAEKLFETVAAYWNESRIEA